MSGLAVRRLSGALGAEIQGVDIAGDIDNIAIATMRNALSEHCILLFRDQKITPAQHIAFTERFGPLQELTLGSYLHADHPEIFVVSNKPVAGKPSDTRNTGRHWHTDMCYTPHPCRGSLLYALEVPPVGGDTVFANMQRAFDTLSDGMRAMIENLRAVHDLSRVPDFKNRDPEATRKIVADNPPVEQPLVWVHPDSGRKSLLLSEHITCRLAGMSDEESKPLIDYLIAHATRIKNTYRHQWRAGDLIFWDNRSVMHCAPGDYDMSDTANRRHMHRTTLAGPKDLLGTTA
ncbi:MAG: TauD/TfdA family dioxygenase [Alphaproteobacteria bacterium]|nr:TauD/TfdA family dioxygenase [Alphaproteobacteria bacterium]